MPRTSGLRRFAWLALGAALAILSGSREASADCSKKGRACCCVGRAAELRCSPARPAEVSAIPATSLRAPACECRADVPAESAFKSDPTPERPDDRESSGGLDGSGSLRDRRATTRSSSPNRPPSLISPHPLYFRISRLQI